MTGLTQSQKQIPVASQHVSGHVTFKYLGGIICVPGL